MHAVVGLLVDTLPKCMRSQSATELHFWAPKAKHWKSKLRTSFTLMKHNCPGHLIPAYESTEVPALQTRQTQATRNCSIACLGTWAAKLSRGWNSRVLGTDKAECCTSVFPAGASSQFHSQVIYTRPNLTPICVRGVPLWVRCVFSVCFSCTFCHVVVRAKRLQRQATWTAWSCGAEGHRCMGTVEHQLWLVLRWGALQSVALKDHQGSQGDVNDRPDLCSLYISTTPDLSWPIRVNHSRYSRESWIILANLFAKLWWTISCE